MPIITEQEAIHHSRDGVSADYYQFPDIMGGTTVANATFTGPHGERTIGEHPRIYAITEGEGEVVINGQKTKITSGDVVVIPPYATYNLFPNHGSVRVVLFMELLDTSKLSK